MDKDSIPATVAAAILQTITNCLTKSWTSLRWMVFASGDLIKHYITSEGTQSKQRGEQNCLLLPPFQIVSHFGFSRYIVFTMYLDIAYIQVYSKSYVPNQTTYSGWSTNSCDKKLKIQIQWTYFVTYVILTTDYII